MREYLKKNRTGMAVLFATLILAGVAIGTAFRLYQLRDVGVTPIAPDQPGAQGSEACLIYAIHDEGTNDSQLFSIDPEDGFFVQAIGPEHTDFDLEGMDMHPGSKELYATTGGGNDVNGSKDSTLYKISKSDGSLTEIGNLGVGSSAPALSFRPNDNTLWGWARGDGLVSININTGEANLVFESNVKIEAITWDVEGQNIYAAGDSNLYKYSRATNTMQKIADNLIGPDDTEALEMNPDGLLIIGHHNADNTNSIYTYDPNTLEVVAAKNIFTQFDDVEAIAWPDSCAPVVIPDHCSELTIFVEQPEESPSPSPSPSVSPSATPTPSAPPEQACNQDCSRTEDCRALDPNYICTLDNVCRLEENPGSLTCELLPTSSSTPTPTSTPTDTPLVSQAPTDTPSPTDAPTTIAQATPTPEQHTLPEAGVNLPTILAVSVAGLLLLGSLILAL